jgi:cell division septation protein DedD
MKNLRVPKHNRGNPMRDRQGNLKYQRGASQGWMLLTIGVIVGFVLGFVLFLSRMPAQNYTLVETERAVETYETADPSQFGFYDNLPGVKDAVPNVEADQMPAFSRSATSGGFGAGENERPGAVEIADEFNNVGVVQPVEVVSAAAATSISGGTAALVQQPTVNQAAVSREVQEPTIVKKVPNAPKTFYYLQAGAFSSQGDANRMQDNLRSSGMDAFIHKVRKDGKLLHRVRIGPFYNADNLRQAQQRLSQGGMGYLVIKVQS